MRDVLKGPVQAVQEFFQLTGRAVRNVARKPLYLDDIFLQMDTIGFGSLPIVLLTGFFSGAVMALQLGKELQTYGRSEEHTSELQSHLNLVCRLLLEKKKLNILRVS